MDNPSSTCPCNSHQSYQACCQMLHNGDTTANTAEQLMRSRYSAFVTGNHAYLIATMHPNKRQADDKVTLSQTIEQTQWLGLKVIEHIATDNNAIVEFVAFYQDETIAQLHERSNFIKENKQWLYVDGQILSAIKVSRNDPCFCGSGKKIKKCHHV